MRIAEFTRHLLMPLAVIGLIPTAWAAVPVAVWDGDFKTNQTQGNYTLGLGGCTAVEGGVRVDTAPFALTNATITTDNKTTFDHTIVMDVELPQELTGALLTFGRWGANTTHYDSDLIGLYLDNGETWGWWNKGKYATIPVSKSTVSSGECRLVYRYLSGGSGVRAQIMYVDGEKVYEAANGLRATIGARTISVGGISVNNSNLLTGLVIKKFALFIEDSLQEDAQYLDYKFPSEVSAYTANNVSGNKDWSDLPFDNDWVNGSDKAAVINLSGDATITLPADLVANKVTFVGNHEVTLVYDTLPSGVGDFIGENLTHTVTAAEIAAGFAVPSSIKYVLNTAVEPTDEMGSVTVDSGATLIVRGVRTTPKFGTTTMKGTLVIEEGATMVANITDFVEFHSATEVHVYGTLDLALTRQTLYPFNKVYLYGGGEITGSTDGAINNGCHINPINAGSGIICKVGPNGEDTATLAAVIGPQGAVTTIDVEDGLNVTLSATVASSTDSRKAGLEKTGAGTLTITGDISTLDSFKCSAGETVVALSAAIPTILAGEGTVTQQPFTFNGTEDALWSKAANWKAGLKPGAGAAVALNAAVTLDETVALNKLTPNGNAVTIAEEMTLTVPSTTDLTVKGAGTLAFSDAVLPNMATLTSLKAALLDADNWTGTLVLKNVQGVLSFDPNTFGNANSTLRLSGVLAYFKNASFTINPTLDLVNSTGDFAYGIKVNNGWGGNVITTKKLTGSGTFLVTKPSGAPRIRFIMQNIADFTGKFDLDTANNASAIVLGVDSATTSNDDDGCVVVKGDVTLPSGATLSTQVPGKSVKIDAGVTLTNDGTIATAVGGSGKVAYVNRTLADLNTAMYTNDLWQGTLVLKDFGGMGSNNHVSGALGNTIPYWGNENSKVEFINVKAYLPNANVTCPYTLVLTDDGENVAWYNDNGYSSNWAKFGGLAGTGTLKDTYASCLQAICFKTAGDFTGTLTLAGKRITIGEAVLSSGSGVVKVESGAAIAAAGQTWTVPGGVTIEGGSSIVYRGGALAVAEGNALTLSGTITVDVPEDAVLDDWTKVLSWGAKPTDVTFEKADGLSEKVRIAVKSDGLYLTLVKPFILSIQ